MTKLSHSKLAQLIEEGSLLPMSKFAAKFKNDFIEAGFVDKKGEVDTKKIADYYHDNYAGLIKTNPKDDDNGKLLTAIKYQPSSPEKLDEIGTSARTHFVSLMNPKDKTFVPSDTFTGECSLVGSHLWPIDQRKVFSVSNAADTPARTLLEKVSISGKYPLPEGISVNDIPQKLHTQIKITEDSVSNLARIERSITASSTPQLLIPYDGSYIAIQPADSPAMITGLNDIIRARIDEAKKNREKGDANVTVRGTPRHTEMLKGVSKKQNLGVPIPGAPLILAAIPPVSSVDSSECLLISNNFQRWLEKKLVWSVSKYIKALSDIRKRIEGKDSTNSKDRSEQSVLLARIARQVKTQIQRVQTCDVSEGLLSETLMQGSENWAEIACQIVDWLNKAVASDKAIFAVTKEESIQWESEIYDHLKANKEID